MEPRINRNIVLIADERDADAVIHFDSDNLDQYTKIQIEQMLAVLCALCKEVMHFTSPKHFLLHITDHQDAVVLPLWSGRASRNRTALLAAISEAAEIDYFGADAYTYIVCQDKALCKVLAAEAGLRTPASVVLRDRRDLPRIKILTPPLIAKPTLEGSSIGISQESYCATLLEAETVSLKLLERFQQPILLEHFIQGSEVTATIWGDADNIKLFQAIEVFDSTGKFDFSKGFWSWELKKAHDRPIKGERPISLLPEDVQSLVQLFKNLGRVELARVDGRIDNEGRFVFLELNPEPDLNPASSVATCFRLNGVDYPQMFYSLLLPFEKCPNGETPVSKK